MSDISLNISGKLDQNTIALYQAVAEQAEALEIPFLVIGASARDIVLHYGHGATIERATADIDFGIEVPNWEAFHVLKDALLEVGFRKTKIQHRIISPEDVIVDIVPFGQIEDDDSNIFWPPNGDWKMNVLGFQEALENAEYVRIQEQPIVDIPVATPEGMVLLKLVAWMDRNIDKRGRDAKDIKYLLSFYEKIPAIENALHKNQQLMEDYDWDITLAAAYQLGMDVAKIAKDQTYEIIAKLLNNEHDKLPVESFIEEMSRRDQDDYERSEALINAFADGFLDDDNSN